MRQWRLEKFQEQVKSRKRPRWCTDTSLGSMHNTGINKRWVFSVSNKFPATGYASKKVKQIHCMFCPPPPPPPISPAQQQAIHQLIKLVFKPTARGSRFCAVFLLRQHADTWWIIQRQISLLSVMFSCLPSEEKCTQFSWEKYRLAFSSNVNPKTDDSSSEGRIHTRHESNGARLPLCVNRHFGVSGGTMAFNRRKMQLVQEWHFIYSHCSR